MSQSGTRSVMRIVLQVMCISVRRTVPNKIECT